MVSVAVDAERIQAELFRHITFDFVIRAYYTLIMRLDLEVVWSPDRIAHIWDRHQVTAEEVEEACYGEIIIRRARTGRVAVFGQTGSGRYLFIIGLMPARGTLFIITAREMEDVERRYYDRRGK